MFAVPTPTIPMSSLLGQDVGLVAASLAFSAPLKEELWARWRTLAIEIVKGYSGLQGMVGDGRLHSQTTLLLARLAEQSKWDAEGSTGHTGIGSPRHTNELD